MLLWPQLPYTAKIGRPANTDKKPAVKNIVLHFILRFCGSILKNGCNLLSYCNFYGIMENDSKSADKATSKGQ